MDADHETGDELGESTDEVDEVDDDLRALVRALGRPRLRNRGPSDDLEVGTKIAAHLEVIRTLGRGAVGVVYLARDLRLQRDVAVKVVETSTPSAAIRLQREAQVMAKLTHPNVVTVYEVGACAGGLFIAMEHVDDGTLRQWLAAVPRPWAEIVGAFAQAARGLHAAHAAGLLHRDFKPDNVLVGADGRVRVADFGLARAQHEAEVPSGSAPSGEITHTEGIVGTPAYLAPEVVLREQSGPLADQFAFGVSLFEALCKMPPYPPAGAWVATPRDQRRPDPALPSWLRRVVLRAIDLDPAARYADVDAIARALEHGLGRRARLRRVAIATGIAVTAISGGIVFGTSMRGDPCADSGAAIEATWNAEHRESVAEAFAATGSPLAGAASRAAQDGLDAWTGAWRDERRDACTATRVRGEQSEARMDLRMDCLDRLGVEVAALVTVLEDADAEVVARTDDLLARLPNTSLCADVPVALRGEVVPPEHRDAYDALFREIVAAEKQYDVGRVSRARAELDALVPRIDEEGLRGLGARARLARGTLLFELGRRDEAIADLAAAHARAVAVDDRAMMLAATLQLARSVGKRSTGTDEALRLVSVLDATIEESGTADIDPSEVDGVRVEVLLFAERQAEVEAVAKAALERAPMDHPKRIRLLTMLGTALMWQHRNDEALAAHREAVATAESLRGPDHPVVAAALGNLAMTQWELGAHDDALASLERALAIRLDTLGADAPATGQTHMQIGDVLGAKGDRSGAVAAYERALAIHRAANDEAGIVFDSVGFAAALASLGRQEESIAMLESLLPLAARVFGPESLNLAKIESNLSGALFINDHFDRARRHGDHALAIYERVTTDDELSVAFFYLNHGRLLATTGDADGGLALIERAERIIRATLPADSLEVASLPSARADVELVRGRVSEAARLRGEQAADYARILGDEHPETILARFRHGRDLLAAGDHVRAREVLERAYASIDRDDLDPSLPARIRWLLAEASWPEHRQRPRARELARRARADMREMGHMMLAELESWMSAQGIE